MKIIAIVQARMRSSRLLGKVMLEVRGKPLIGFLIDRLELVRGLSQIVVAMPRRDYDSALFKYCESRKVTTFAGCDENDVAGRFIGVVNATGCDALIRICADSPLIDPRLVEGAVEALSLGSEFYTTVGLKYLSRGQSIEACTAAVYKQLEAKCTPEDREHAGFPYLYRVYEDKSTLVDTPEDFERVKKIIEKMDRPHTDYNWQDLFRV